MSGPIRLAVVGMGKIAHDQHLPSVAGNDSFELAATVSRHGGPEEGVAYFHTIEELAASEVAIDAVAICTPPQVRQEIAAFAIDQGWHVMLEKPPAATISEVAAMRDHAAAKGVTLQATWHSRYAKGVEPARQWLSGRTVKSARVSWREDVRVWHPGQAWIFEPGGFGVFDPGINALSIITRILPFPLFVRKAELSFPANCGAPIAAEVSMEGPGRVPVEMDLDFLHEGHQTWDIVVETDGGTLKLAEGGAILSIDGDAAEEEAEDLQGEYPALYARFAELIAAGESDVDVSPLRLVADSFLCGKITMVEDFVE